MNEKQINDLTDNVSDLKTALKKAKFCNVDNANEYFRADSTDKTREYFFESATLKNDMAIDYINQALTVIRILEVTLEQHLNICKVNNMQRKKKKRANRPETVYSPKV